MRVPRLVALVALIAGSVSPAMASPAGVWELETRDTRFQLELCGDGTQLCGQLSWLSDADYNNQYKPYLNQPMATYLKQTSPGVWKGNMKLFGYNMSGTITQHNENSMTLQGCAMLVICKTYGLFRYSE